MKTVRSWEQMTFRTTLKTEIFEGKVDLRFSCVLDSSAVKWKNKHLDSVPVSFFPSTPTGNLKLSGLFIELSNQWSKVKFELADAEASGFYDQVTYLDSKPLIELSILAVYLAEYLFAYTVSQSTRIPWNTAKIQDLSTPTSESHHDMDIRRLSSNHKMRLS